MGKPIAFVSFILFPTELSDKTTVSIEEGSGLLFMTLNQGEKSIRLDLDETFGLKDILSGLNKTAPQQKEGKS